MRPLSVEEQDRALRAFCPQFRLVLHAGWIGIWEGTLRPICQTYRVRIVYFSRRCFDGWCLENRYVNVFVIDPPIGADPRGTGEPPQHVYRLAYPPEWLIPLTQVALDVVCREVGRVRSPGRTHDGQGALAFRIPEGIF